MAFDWGGDVKQIKSILEKAVNSYEKVLIPNGVTSFKYDTFD